MLWPGRRERIARIADRWAARSAGRLDPQEQTERDTWRRADPAHEAAWQRSQSLLTVTDGMRRPAEEREPRSRRGFQPVYAFAGLVAAIAAGGGAILIEKLGSAQPATVATEYAATNSRSQVRLKDGTLVDLDPGSAVRADYSGAIRAVLVEHGTARFDVAHDPLHPFVVSAADRKVTAIGTRFEVALRTDGVVVTLYQGAIEVAGGSAKRKTPPVRMTHGQRLSITGDRQVLSNAPPDDLSAQDVPDVDPTPVANIVAEANLHAAVPIRFADPDLGARRVEGRFDTRDTAALAVQLGAALDLTVTRISGAYLLSSH